MRFKSGARKVISGVAMLGLLITGGLVGQTASNAS